jgi:hypothetical protein
MMVAADLIEHPLANRSRYDDDMHAIAQNDWVGHIEADEQLHSSMPAPQSDVLLVVTDDGKFGVICPGDVERVKAVP